MKFSKELSVLLSMTLMAASSVSVSAAELPVFEEAGPIVEAAMDGEQGEEPSPLSSAGEMYTVEGIKGGRVQFDKNTGTITWFETGVTEALIPESIDGTTVTTIGAWVGQNSNIEKLSIPSTVTTLEEGVFRNMKITELTVPGSISQISKNSFAYNKYLKTVILESGVTEIGSYCFQYCDTLETLSMPKTLKKIGEYSFRSCADLESVTYDNRSFYPFDGDEDKYVTCEEGCFVGALFGHPDFSDSYKTGKWYRQLHEVTPTGDYLADLFAIAQSQMGYHEGNSLKEMDGNQKGKGDYAEYNYWWNEPGSMWCGEYVAWCLAMASTPYEIVHPKYTMIGRDGNNRNVAWTDTVYAGGEKAYELKKGDVILFRYKNGNHIILVESASVNGNVVTVESLNGNHSNDVSRNTYTINASTGKTINEWSDINGYVDNIYSPDFSIADELQYYTVTFDMQGGNASWSSKRLTDNASYGIMPLPAKTDYTFDGWYTAAEGGKKITSYRRARLSGDQTLYAHWTTGEQKPEEPEEPEEPETPEEPEIDTSKWSFDKTSGTITRIPYDWTGGTIPDQIDGVAVKAIGDYACSSRLSLKTLTIPGSVKTIGKGAFQGCRAMTKLVIAEGVETIMDYAFSGCYLLEGVSIPASVKTIGSQYGNVFSNCNELEAVSFAGNKSGIKCIGRGNFNATLFLRSDFSEPYKRSEYYKKLMNVELTGDYVKDTLAIAASQEGYHEGDSYEEMDGSNKKGKGDYAEMAYFTCSPSYRWMARKGLTERELDGKEYDYGGWCGNYCNWCMAMASVPEELHGWWTMHDDEYPVWADTVYAGGAKAYQIKAGDVIHMNIGHYCLVTEVKQEGDVITVGTWNGNNENDVGFDYNDFRASDGYNLTMANEYNRPGSTYDYGERYQVKWIEPSQADRIADVTFYTATFDGNGGTVPAGRETKKYAASAYYGIMPEPVRDGYRFDGWYTKAEGGKKMTAYHKTRLTQDITLYAHWTEKAVSGSSGSGLDPLPVSEISGSEITLWMVPGQKYELGKGTFSSTDRSIAAVTNAGRITAKKKGTAKITGKTAAGDEISCTVKVAAPVLSNKTLRMLVGQSTAEAEADLQLALSFGDAEADRYPVSWTSAKPEVAVVDENGAVTAIAKGTCVISAWCGGKAYKCTVTVVDNPSLFNPKPAKIVYDDTIALNAFGAFLPKYKTANGTAFRAKDASWVYYDEAKGEYAEFENVTNNRGKVIALRNDVVEITLSNGRIKGVGPGKVTILGFDAQSRKDFEAGKITSLEEMVSTKLTVQVMAVPTANAVYLASGKTAALRFNGVKAAVADWELKDTVCDGSGCIELVQNNGKYTGKVRAAAGISGQATVICRYRGFTWETTVYAENPSLKTEDGITGSGLSYTLSGLAVGETRMLSVQGTHQKPLFTSSKNDVAFVDENGKLFARGKGKAVLQTRICGKTLKLTVTVE